jgi:tight adherence protein B
VSVIGALLVGVCCALAVGALTGSLPDSPRRWRRIRVNRAVAVTGGVAIATFLAAAALTGSLFIAVVPALAVATIPRALAARRAARARSTVQAAWPDGLRELATSLSAGRSLGQAVQDLAEHGPLALRAPFARFPQLAPMLGVGPALDLVKADFADPTSDRIIEVLMLAHDRGGAIVREIISDLIDATTRDVRLAEEIATDGLEMRINARSVVVLPWLVLVALTARAGPFRSFYRTTGGLVTIALAAALTAAGVVVLRRLGREPIEPRVFAC